MIKKFVRSLFTPCIILCIHLLIQSLHYYIHALPHFINAQYVQQSLESSMKSTNFLQLVGTPLLVAIRIRNLLINVFVILHVILYFYIVGQCSHKIDIFLLQKILWHVQFQWRWKQRWQSKRIQIKNHNLRMRNDGRMFW